MKVGRRKFWRQAVGYAGYALLLIATILSVALLVIWFKDPGLSYMGLFRAHWPWYLVCFVLAFAGGFLISSH